jgi:hypothetical protein
MTMSSRDLLFAYVTACEHGRQRVATKLELQLHDRLVIDDGLAD